MSNLTEPQSLLKEIAKQTSGELTSVEVIAYVEALCRSASTLTAEEKDYTVKPSAINSTLRVIFVYHSSFSINIWSFALNWFRGEQMVLHTNVVPCYCVMCSSGKKQSRDFSTFVLKVQAEFIFAKSVKVLFVFLTTIMGHH